jgi:hypothetical protein
MTARELFEKAGTNACAVGVRGPDVQVSYPGGSWLLPAEQWEYYLAICANWRAAGMDVPAAVAETPPLRAVLEALLRELGGIRTAVAAAGVSLDALDLEDALVLIGRRLEGCEQQVQAVLTADARVMIDRARSMKGGAA